MLPPSADPKWFTNMRNKYGLQWVVYLPVPKPNPPTVDWGEQWIIDEAGSKKKIDYRILISSWRSFIPWWLKMWWRSWWGWIRSRPPRTSLEWPLLRIRLGSCAEISLLSRRGRLSVRLGSVWKFLYIGCRELPLFAIYSPRPPFRIWLVSDLYYVSCIEGKISGLLFRVRWSKDDTN